MKTADIIKAIAELDGWINKPTGSNLFFKNGIYLIPDCSEFPKYLTSHDAILPVIEKATTNPLIGLDFIRHLQEICEITDEETGEPMCPDELDLITATPSQLCEALLRATNKWTE